MTEKDQCGRCTPVKVETFLHIHDIALRAKCSVKDCGNPAASSCDFVVKDGSATRRTCDRLLCEEHATVIGPNRDLCPSHATHVGHATPAIEVPARRRRPGGE